MSANFTLVPTMNASAAAVVSIVPHVFREGAEVATQSYLVGQDDADVVKNGRDNEPLGQPRRTGCR